MSEIIPHLSTDREQLARSLVASERLLIIQDLDGVCMGLVRDPRTRVLDRSYLDAAASLAGEFFVLTNGEHDGERGVNAIVDAAFGGSDGPRAAGSYLPGLAAGGVQLQDRFGVLRHPGVSDREIRFLASVPQRAEGMLKQKLGEQRFSLETATIDRLVAACVLNNRFSPTVNLNPLHDELRGSPDRYRELQSAAAEFLHSELRRAGAAGLANSFFVHFAPNQGRDASGRERLRPARGEDAGTTDFQLMLRGAVKEAGVLVILNHYYREHYGEYPLGEDFNVREAPGDENALLDLAVHHFDRQRMPRVVGVGDTLTSDSLCEIRHRGGSDRGFLQLVQGLGQRFASDNLAVYVDSSGGEVRRPGLGRPLAQGERPNWSAFEGITDAQDPLRINYLFPDGHRSYVESFCKISRLRRLQAR